MSSIFWIFVAVALLLCAGLLRRQLKASTRQRTLHSTPPMPKSMDSGALLVLKHYSTGRNRPTSVKIEQEEHTSREEAIFASPPAIKSWNDLCLQPAIGADGELDEPLEPLVSNKSQIVAEFRDPAVEAALGALDIGKQVLAGEMTDEERSAVAHFDLQSFR